MTLRSEVLLAHFAHASDVPHTSIYEFIPPVADVVQTVMGRAGTPHNTIAQSPSEQIGFGSAHKAAREACIQRHATWRHVERSQLPKKVPQSAACASVCRSYGLCVCSLPGVKAALTKLVVVLEALCKVGSRTRGVVDSAGLVLAFQCEHPSSTDTHGGHVAFLNQRSWAVGVVKLYLDDKVANKVRARNHHRAYHQALRAAPLGQTPNPTDVSQALGVANAAQWFLSFDLSKAWSLRLYEIAGSSTQLDEFIPAEVEVRWFGETFFFWSPADRDVAPVADVPGVGAPEVPLPIGDEVEDDDVIHGGDPAAPEAPAAWADEAAKAVQFWAEHEV